MPFADFSGPPQRLGEPTRKIILRRSYAVSSFVGPAQSSSGASPQAFSREVLCRVLICRVHSSVSGSHPASFFGGSPMPFPHFSGPPSRIRERARKLFQGKSKAVYCFFFPGPPERLGEPARTLVRKKSYAVSSLFGPAQSSSGARPKAFFCFKGSPMPFADFSGPPQRLGEPTRKVFRRKSYAFSSFFGSVHLQNAHESFYVGSPTPFARNSSETVFRRKSYAVC